MCILTFYFRCGYKQLLVHHIVSSLLQFLVSCISSFFSGGIYSGFAQVWIILLLLQVDDLWYVFNRAYCNATIFWTGKSYLFFSPPTVPEEATYSLRPGVAYKTKGGVGIGFQFFGEYERDMKGVQFSY